MLTYRTATAECLTWGHGGTLLGVHQLLVPQLHNKGTVKRARSLPIRLLVFRGLESRATTRLVVPTICLLCSAMFTSFLSRPILSSSILCSCHVLSCLVLALSVQFSSAFISCPVLSCPLPPFLVLFTFVVSCSVTSYRVQFGAVQRSPSLPGLAICPCPGHALLLLLLH